MLFATVGQGALFLWMMVAGMIVGLWYGITALLRRILRAKLLLSFVCDLLFALGAAAILLGFMFVGNYCQMRLFLFLGAALGFSLFCFALAKPMQRLMDILKNAGKRIMSRISKNRFINVIFR